MATLRQRIRELRAIANRRREATVFDERELLQIAERIFASERNRHVNPKTRRRWCACVSKRAEVHGGGVLVSCVQEAEIEDPCDFAVWFPREHLEMHVKAVA